MKQEKSQLQAKVAELKGALRASVQHTKVSAKNACHSLELLQWTPPYDLSRIKTTAELRARHNKNYMYLLDDPILHAYHASGTSGILFHTEIES